MTSNLIRVLLIPPSFRGLAQLRGSWPLKFGNLSFWRRVASGLMQALFKVGFASSFGFSIQADCHCVGFVRGKGTSSL